MVGEVWSIFYIIPDFKSDKKREKIQRVQEFNGVGTLGEGGGFIGKQLPPREGRSINGKWGDEVYI